MGLLDFDENIITDDYLKNIIVDFLFQYYGPCYDNEIGVNGTFLRKDFKFTLRKKSTINNLLESFISIDTPIIGIWNEWEIVISDNIEKFGNTLHARNDVFSYIKMKFILEYMNRNPA